MSCRGAGMSCCMYYVLVLSFFLLKGLLKVSSSMVVAGTSRLGKEEIVITSSPTVRCQWKRSRRRPACFTVRSVDNIHLLRWLLCVYSVTCLFAHKKIIFLFMHSWMLIGRMQKRWKEVREINERPTSPSLVLFWCGREGGPLWMIRTLTVPNRAGGTLSLTLSIQHTWARKRRRRRGGGGEWSFVRCPLSYPKK